MLSGETDNSIARPGKRKPVEASDQLLDLKKARIREPPSKAKLPKKASAKGDQQRDGLIIIKTSASDRRAPYAKAPTPLPEDLQADEDVRLMNEESLQLKNISLNHAQTASTSGLNVKFGTGLAQENALPDPRRPSTVPVATAETPVQQKNKQLRERLNHSGSKRRLRRSSSSLGNSGVITHPHPSVPAANFFKHLDPKLPDSVRFRHLLVWCANRAITSPPRTRSSSGVPLPPLSQQGSQVVSDVQNKVIQLLAEGKIPTPVSSQSGGTSSGNPANLKEHPQNTKNRATEDTLLKHLNQAKSELESWNKTIESYNTIRVSMQESLNFQKRLDQRKISKGKERDLLQWEPWEDDTTNDWGPAVEIAKECLGSRVGQSAASLPFTDPQLERVDFKVDKLCERLHVLSQSALQTSRELDTRFRTLSLALEHQARLPLSQAPDPAREALRSIADADTKRGAMSNVPGPMDNGHQISSGRVTPFPPTPRTPRRGTTPNR